MNVPRWGEMNRLDKSLTMGLVIGVVVSGALLSSFVAAPKVGERFTQFYVLGSGGKIERYPTNLTLGENGTVILGVINQEFEEVNYSVVVKLDNETIGTVDNVGLMHEEKWEQNFTFTPEEAGDKIKLEFLLFREGADDPYRSLQLWISVRPQE